MSQHCQRDMANTPRRRVNFFLAVQPCPLAVSYAPPRPLAGWTQVSGACRFRLLGVLSCVLCHVRKTGSVRSSWVPRTCSKIPRNGSWKCSLMCPGGGNQAGMWMGLVSPQNSGTFKRWVTERGVFAFACQYIVSPHRWVGNRTVTQI